MMQLVGFRRWGCAALLLACFASSALAQPYDDDFRPSDALKEPNTISPPRMVGKGQNAAVAYFAAWDMMSRKESRPFSEIVSDLPPPDQKLKAATREALVKNQAHIEAIMAAAAMPNCDWGKNWDAGWHLLLPHLGYLRQSTRTLAADARRCAEEGSAIGAAERVQAILRISKHASEDPVLICSLVGVAIGAKAVMVTEELIDQKQLTPATAKMLLNAFKAVPRKDMYNSRASIARERQVTVEWLRNQCTGERAGLTFARVMGYLGGGLGDPFDPIASMNEQQIERQLQLTDRYYGELIAAWDAPNADVRIHELETELTEFQFGVVATIVSPAVTKARKSVVDVRGKFEKIERRLAAIASPPEEAPAGSEPAAK